MAERLRIARLFLVLLALVGGGRWALGFAGVPYEKGTMVFSIVVLGAFSSLYHGAFTRRWRGYSLMEAAMLGVTIGLCGQLFILFSTLLSYALSLQTYFNNPVALNSPAPLGLLPALAVRLGGLVANTIASGIIASLGWVMGGLLPEGSRPA